MEIVLDDPRFLSPKMAEGLRREYDEAETFGDLSPFALAMYNRTKSMLEAECYPRPSRSPIPGQPSSDSMARRSAILALESAFGSRAERKRPMGESGGLEG